MKEEFKKYLAMILAVFCTAALSILFFFILFRMDALQSLIGKILNILMPFIYGAGIAYVLKPLCNTYERFLNKHWHPKRQKLIVTVSVIGSIVTGLVVIYAVLAMLLPQLALSVARIARSLPEMIESISHMVDHLFEGNEVIQNYIMQLSDAGTESLSGWLKESILPYMNMILTGLSDSMINVAGIFMDLFIGLVVAIYLLYGRRKFKKQGKLLLYSLFKARWADKIIEEIRFADRVFSGFIGGKLLDSAIIGGICYIGMMIMGLPYAILISVIVGVTNIIPFFRTIHRRYPIGDHFADGQSDVLSDVCYFYCDFAAGGRQYHRAEDSWKQYGIIRYLGAFLHSAFRRLIRFCRHAHWRACFCGYL